MKNLWMIFTATIVSILAVGCATGPRTKADLRSYVLRSEIVAGEYHALAKKWDEHAQKLSVDFAPSTSLVFDESRGTAEITVQGPGGPYGMIELTRVDAARTRMTGYGWDGGVNKKLEQWMNLIADEKLR